jgi:hypothetical protein
MAITTHLPTHVGKLTKGRIAEQGERITCPACKRQIAEAQALVSSYAQAVDDDLAGNVPGEP